MAKKRATKNLEINVVMPGELSAQKTREKPMISQNPKLDVEIPKEKTKEKPSDHGNNSEPLLSTPHSYMTSSTGGIDYKGKHIDDQEQRSSRKIIEPSKTQEETKSRQGEGRSRYSSKDKDPWDKFMAGVETSKNETDENGGSIELIKSDDKESSYAVVDENDFLEAIPQIISVIGINAFVIAILAIGHWVVKGIFWSKSFIPYEWTDWEMNYYFMVTQFYPVWLYIATGITTLIYVSMASFDSDDDFSEYQKVKGFSIPTHIIGGIIACHFVIQTINYIVFCIWG